MANRYEVGRLRAEQDRQLGHGGSAAPPDELHGEPPASLATCATRRRLLAVTPLPSTLAVVSPPRPPPAPTPAPPAHSSAACARSPGAHGAAPLQNTAPDHCSSAAPPAGHSSGTSLANSCGSLYRTSSPTRSRPHRSSLSAPPQAVLDTFLPPLSHPPAPHWRAPRPLAQATSALA